MTNQELREYNKTRAITQICAITNDIERTMKEWVEKLQIGPWSVKRFNSENMDWLEVHGRKLDKETEPWEFIIAHSYVGNMEIELLQPVKGPTIYQDWLERRGEGLHHFKEKIDSDEALAQRLKEWEALGMKMIEGGKFFNDVHAYVDSEQFVGFSVEMGNSPAVFEIPEGMEVIYPPED